MSLPSHYTLIAASLLSLPAALPSWANDVPQLPGIQVSGQGFTQTERETATSTFVIDEEEIKNSTAHNLSELLIEQGFIVEGTPTDYGEGTLLIRGFHTEHLQTEVNGKVLILIDGRRSGVANVRQIMLGNIERIEVLRGPEMFKYSMGSPGGVINVITKRGGPGYFGGQVRMGYGSWDTSKIGVDLHGAADNFDYMFGYEHGAVRSNYKDGDRDTVHNTKTDGTERFNFNVGYTFDNGHRIGIDGYQYTVDAAHRPSYVDEEGERREASFTDRKTQLYYLNYDGASTDRRFSWNANIGQGKDEYQTYSFGSRYPKGQEVRSDRAQGSLTYTTDRFDLTGGLDYIKYDVRNSSSVRGAFLNNGGLDPVWAGIGYPMHDTSKTSIAGAYLVGTLKLMDNTLNLSGGLRYERVKATDLSVGDEHYERVPYFVTRGITRDQLPTRRTFEHVSPTVGISWLPTDWAKLRANYTQGWRAPSGRQLFASSFYEDYGAPGDPRLKPEFTDAYEIGFDLKRKDWMVSATYFYYDIKDSIFIYPGVRPDGSGSQGRVLQNVEKRVQEGIELQANANIAPALGYSSFELRPYVHLTHMFRMEEVIEHGGPGLRGTWWPINRTPDTTASFGLRFYHPGWKFSSNLNFTYSGKQYGRSNVGDTVEPESFGKFTVTNLSMTKRLWEAKDVGSLDVKLNVNNLFNKQYSYQGSVPDTYGYQGRSFFASLIYQF